MPYTTLKNKSKQSGFTLVELMVSSVIGLMVMAGTITFFVNTVQGNSIGLKQVHLNQELRALMDVMVRDIRRAGYSRNADGVSTNIYATNQHALNISNGNCITYSYDDYQTNNSNPNVVQNSDTAGFKLSNNIIKIRKKSSLCTSNVNWDSISDGETIKITKLEFKNTNICANISSPLTPVNDQRGCQNNGGPGLLLPPEQNDTLASMNVITITLSGELISDPSVSTTDITETIAVRNSINSLVL